jgi:hypothetical protein
MSMEGAQTQFIGDTELLAPLIQRPVPALFPALGY